VENLRIRTDIGLNNVYLKFKLEQNFENLEILSLKIEQDRLYQRFCSDYGVVCGRVITNDGFGVANAKISVFIPISEDDELRDEIFDIYPFKTPFDKNEITKTRYNLLPENKQRPIHQPVGTFPVINKIITNENYLEVHEKYYKFTTRTNSAGDYMLFGVPTGLQTIHMDMDVSDIESLSLNPENFIANGFPEEFFESINGVTQFKVSTNLDELPQIITQNISVNVQPLWGDIDNCEIGITRQDFDITNQLIINPIAVIFGSAISSIFPKSQYTTESGNQSFTNGCNSSWANYNGLCEGKYGSYHINKGNVSVSCDVYNSDRNFYKTFTFDDGKILISLPMNTERYITDEIGNPVLSQNPNVGIPTKSNYYFNFYVNKLFGEEFNTARVSNNSLVRCANYISYQPITLEYDIFNKQIQFYTLGTFFKRNPNVVPQLETINSQIFLYYNLNNANMGDPWEVLSFYDNVPLPSFNQLPVNTDNVDVNRGSGIDYKQCFFNNSLNGVLYFHTFELKDNGDYSVKVALNKSLFLNGIPNTPNYDFEFIYNLNNLDIVLTNSTNDLKNGLTESSKTNFGVLPSNNIFSGKYYYFGKEKNQTVLQKLKQQFDGQI